jgi:hypothetical protein
MEVVPVGKRKADNSDLVVRLEDTYDPADYVLVHKRYFEGMRDAIREAHGKITCTPVGSCLCIYCTAAVSAGEKP